MVMAFARGKTNTDFKQSEVGPIPTDWSVKLLPEVCRFRGGKAHEQFVSKYGKYVCVNAKFISTDGAVRKFATKNFCPAKRGDILMVMSDLPNGKALAKTYICDVDDLYAVNQRVCSLTPYRDDSKYLAYALNRNRYFLRFDDGVSQTHLLNPVFQKCPVVIPSSIAEQQAVAAALSDADALIEALESLLAKKRAIKQGAMHELLTGRRRLPGFSGEWQTRKLGSFGHFLKGRGVKKDQAQTGDLPCIRYGEIYTGHNDVLRSFRSFISRDVAATATRIKAGDILFAGSGETKEEIGKCVGFPAPIEAYAGGDIVILRTTGHDPVFLGYALNLPDVQRQKAAKGQGDAVVHISTAALASIDVVLPDPEEQQAIAGVLSEMDSELEILTSRLTKARQIKQGMMQQLLTGRVRLA